MTTNISIKIIIVCLFISQVSALICYWERLGNGLEVSILIQTGLPSIILPISGDSFAHQYFGTWANSQLLINRFLNAIYYWETNIKIPAIKWSKVEHLPGNSVYNFSAKSSFIWHF